ncbi:hypothetical protein HUU40_18880, partial [candidate division KSB1 bacterium]|nr:hypothetical protein [candidate division KSB1 bacterium]
MQHLLTVCKDAVAKLCTLFGVAMLAFSPLFAGPPDSLLHFEVDYARFRINDNVAQLEIYISVPRSRLQFVAEGEDLLASFESQVIIAIADSDVVDHKWVEHTVAADSAEIKPTQILCTQANFQVPVNTYDVNVRVTDPRTKHFGVRSFQVNIAPFAKDRLVLSDLEIASRIARDTTVSRFYKNNHLVIPNPSRMYGANLPMLFTYAEIYNLSYPSDSSYSVAYRILDG